MEAKYGMLCYKNVKLNRDDINNLKIPNISEIAKNMIVQAKIDNLNDLLSENWQNASLTLIKKYWGIK